MVHHVHVRALLSALIFCSIAAPAAASDFDRWGDEDEPGVEDRYTLGGAPKIPVRMVDRPLTLTRGTYGLGFDLAFTRLGPSTQLLAFDAGSGFGVTDDLEVGILLVPLTLSQERDSGLGPPRFLVDRRLIRGVFELSVGAEVELPLGSTFHFGGRIPFRLHLGGFASIDSGVRVDVAVGAGAFEPTVSVPLSIGVQLAEQLAVSFTAQAAVTDFERNRVLGNFGARVGWTITDKHGAWGDLGLLFRTRNIALEGALPSDPQRGNYFTVAIVTRFFIQEEPRDSFDF